jgi:hypothetical protein
MNIIAPASNPLSRREANARFLNVIWRWFLVVAGSASSGTVIFGAVHTGAGTAVTVATTGVAVTVLIAFFADIMGLLAGCRAYMRGHSDSLKPLTSGFWKVWGSLTTIVIALYAFEASRSQSTTQHAADPVPDPWYVVYSSRPPPDGFRLSTISVLYANSADRNQWLTGVSFTQKEIDVSLRGLGRIMAAFAACGSVPAAPLVQLKIEGFASSKEFGEPKTDNERLESDTLNVEAANRRAWAGYCFAKEHTGAQLVNFKDWQGSQWTCPASKKLAAGRIPVSAEVTRWANDEQGFRQMMGARKYLDRPQDIPDEHKRDPEELDRRVDFSVIHAGACEKGSIANSQSVAANKAR